jgi:hypothetical protein
MSTFPIDNSEHILPLPKGIRKGKLFAQLSVLSRDANDSGGRVMLRCKCNCPRETVVTVRLSDLKSGHTKSCGCLRAATIRHRFGKIQFKQFGPLWVMGTALGAEGKPITVSTEWCTICVECGKVVIATSSQLRRGRKNCPCLKETYSSWRNMIQRCTNPKHDKFMGHGGRGITVCDEWLQSFHKFYNDMGKRPKGTTIHRRDNNGNYTPSNCEWSNKEVQARNRRPRKKEPTSERGETVQSRNRLARKR